MTNSLRKGPFRHRLLIWIFTFGLGLLTFWLLGFITRDFDERWPQPDRSGIFAKYLSNELTTRASNLERSIKEKEQRISQLQGQQRLLRDSIDSSKRTMDQLLELQRLSLEKSVTLPAESQAAMDDSLRAFLANQQQYQVLSNEITNENRLNGDLRDQEKACQLEIQQASEPAYRELEQQHQQRVFRIAAAKLGLLVPLLLLAGGLFYRKHENLYAPVLFATGAALAIRVMLVLHEHFPFGIFRYILIIVAILVVFTILVRLLRNIAMPDRNWLLKQYREAYMVFVCPVCEYPIRRGPLKYLAWTARTIRKSILRPDHISESAPDQPYICPCCSTPLFEECTNCHSIRHSLLPSCEKCGSKKESSTDVSSVSPPG